MRVKHVLVLVSCVCLSTLLYVLLVANPRPSITSIHQHLSHFKGVVINNNYNYNNIYFNTRNDIDSEESERNCDKYLRILGLRRNDTDNKAGNVSAQLTSGPVFVTAVHSDQSDVVKGMIRAFADNLSNYSLIIYDIGLSRRQLLSISSICNESQAMQNNSRTDATPAEISSALGPSSVSSVSGVGPTLCAIRRFDYQSFPSHVSDLKLSAFRPLIMQLVLSEFGSAFWLDPNYYPLPSAQLKVQRLWQRARKEGVLSWTIEQPTSTLTHPRMFDYFKTDQNQFYFHRMVRASHLLLYATERVRTELMLPWVKCALTHECIAPIGSQSSGCRFDKKPLYRYSGCHDYDTSALNVVLAKMFRFDESPYAADEDDKFFRVIAVDDELYTEADTSDPDYVPNTYIRGRPLVIDASKWTRGSSAPEKTSN